MKKLYSKPEIIFEDFTLSENIAGDCELKTTLPNRDSGCGYYTRGGNVFLTGISGCTTTEGVDAEGAFNGFCYHIPTEGNNLFNS